MIKFDPFPSGLMLKQIAPIIHGELAVRLKERGFTTVAVELEKLVIPQQALAGTENSFSCMAYSVPRLSLEAREQIELFDPQRIVVECNGGMIIIDFDDFGKINWLTMSNMPWLYESLRSKQTSSPDGAAPR